MRLMLAVVVVLAAAGCTGKPPKPPSPPSAPSSVQGAPSAPGAPGASSGSLPSGSSATAVAAGSTRCHTAVLSVHVEGHGEAAGQRYAFLGLTGKGSAACTVYGYPGLQLVDAAGNAMPTKVTRDAARPPTLLTVQPGQTVWATLHWTVVPANDEAATMCAPAPTGLRVIPPDETTQLSMPFWYGPVCQHGALTVGPFQSQRPPDD